MSARTRSSKSRIKQLLGIHKSKAWKSTLQPLMIEVPTVSRAGVSYTKRMRFDKAPTRKPTPIMDMINYISSFFGGIFR